MHESLKTARECGFSLSESLIGFQGEDAVVRGEAGVGPSEVGPSADRDDRERQASTESSAGKARRLELANMLKDVFMLDEVEEVVGRDRL